jgi:ABC-2 type transport system permease protein
MFRHLVDTYRNFISCSLTEELSFRLNFILLLFVDIIFLFSTLGATYVLFEHIDYLGPWNQNQLLFFLCFMLVVDDFQSLVLSSNFWMLSVDLKAGNLDFTFLKPIPSLFPMFFRYLRPSSALSTLVSLGLLIYFGIQLQFSLIQFALILPLLLMAICLRFLIEMVIALSMFWTTEGAGINFLRLQLQALSRWPDIIYRGVAKKVLSTILPVLMVGSAPMHFLFDLSQWHYLLIMAGLCVCFYLVLKYLWSWARRRYESASS